MSEGDSKRARRRRVDGKAKAMFVEAMRAGIGRDEAARRAGFTSEAFYYARRRDALFRFAWIWAIELSAADEREEQRAATLAAAAREDCDILPNNKRILQRRRKRGTAFTDKRKRIFLDHFAGTADVQAACDAANIHYSTVYEHRRKDPRFAAGWDEALAQSYAALEAEEVRRRLEAQRRAGFEPQAAGEMTQEFERVMKLLDRYERRNGRIGTRAVGRGRERRMSFDDAIVALDKRLRALGLRHGIAAEPIALPPPPARNGDADGGEG